jgi:hypothetical protein
MNDCHTLLSHTMPMWENMPGKFVTMTLLQIECEPQRMCLQRVQPWPRIHGHPSFLGGRATVPPVRYRNISVMTSGGTLFMTDFAARKESIRTPFVWFFFSRSWRHFSIWEISRLRASWSSTASPRILVTLSCVSSERMKSLFLQSLSSIWVSRSSGIVPASLKE